MIALDFGILFSVQAQVAGLPAAVSGFRIEPDTATRALLGRLQSSFRFLDEKTYVFASDIIGRYEEEEVGSRRLAKLKEINRAMAFTFQVIITDKRLYTLLDLDFRMGDLAGLEGLPGNFKRIYYVDGNQLPGANPVGHSAIVGLAPPQLAVAKNQVESINHVRSGKILLAVDEDDERVQYDFRNAVPGLYEIRLNMPAPRARRFYANPELYARPPFAAIEIEVPKGAFTLKEYTIEFKER